MLTHRGQMMNTRTVAILVIWAAFSATGVWAQQQPTLPMPAIPREYAFPPFPDARDNTAIEDWARRNVLRKPTEPDWFYIDDRWAVYVAKWDHDGGKIVAMVRFEVTSETWANFAGFRSMLRWASIDCPGRTIKWVTSFAWTGNNEGGAPVHIGPEAATPSPFSDPRTAEGALTDKLCSAVAALGPIK